MEHSASSLVAWFPAHWASTIAPLILEPEEGDGETREGTRAENCSFQSIKSTQQSRGQDSGMGVHPLAGVRFSARKNWGLDLDVAQTL